MSDHPEQVSTTPTSRGRQRRLPTQRRSRERYERILEVAVEVLAEKGGEAFTMTDIVGRADVPYGSLYQYFPDKTALIGALAERCNAKGQACVHDELASVDQIDDLYPALCRIVDGYYGMFLTEPAMRDIWFATQADKTLQKMDEEDMNALAGLLADTLARLLPEPVQAGRIRIVSELLIQMIAAGVRHAVACDAEEGRRAIGLLKRMLPRDVSDLVSEADP